MGLAASILLYTTTSTWAYFQQSELAGGVLKTSTARTEFFGSLEIWVNSITVLIQIFLTGRLLKWFGVGFTLIALPFVSMIGFAANERQSRNLDSRNSCLTGCFASPGTLSGCQASNLPSRVRISTVGLDADE